VERAFSGGQLCAPDFRSFDVSHLLEKASVRLLAVAPVNEIEFRFEAGPGHDGLTRTRFRFRQAGGAGFHRRPNGMTFAPCGAMPGSPYGSVAA
jgi:hypothetical protein